MSLDIATTHYAISNQIGYEGNGFMSGIVSNPILFILTKLIGSMVIIFMMKLCLERNKKVSFIGMRLISFMMLFVLVNNLFVISANALSFSNFSATSTSTGSVNSGNGYFDDEAFTFNYSGSRNVFVVAEATQIWIFEPISYSAGASNPYALINSSTGLIKDAVVHNGYLYFIDNGALKKKKTRNLGNLCESTDTTAGGCVQIIVASGVGNALKVHNDVLYYTAGANLKHLDADDNAVSDFSLPTIPGGESQYSSFGVTTNGSDLQAYVIGFTGADDRLVTYKAGAVSADISGVISGNSVSWATFFETSTYMYILDYQVTGGNPTIEYLKYKSNSTTKTVDYATTNALALRNRAYVGGQSTLGLMAQSTTSYETFNSNEIGVGSLPTVPSQITYTTKTIESLDSQYYNKSDIYLEYNVVINSVNVNNLLLDLTDYRWMISMTDPNGVTTDIIQSPACSTTSIFDTSCQVTSTMGIHAPPNGWLQGTWYAKLYEINTVNPNRALIATSSAFTVLNTSLENQSVIPPPFEPPTSGTGPQAITIIDRFVGWLGLGVNSVSKLLFAMIIIAIAATVGLLKGNGNIAMVFAFVPYAFFTFIDYIPKWIFIIAIILIAITSKAFR